MSDKTAITAANLGRSLLTQFPDIEFVYNSLPFVDTEEKALAAADAVRSAAARDGVQPLVFCTFVDARMTEILRGSGAPVLELFSTFSKPLEEALGVAASHYAGRTHGMGDRVFYERRLDALNYTLGHDDGIKVSDLSQADLVLVGVSRCGKTPTCLYLSLQFYLKAANYPLLEEDLERLSLPRCLVPCRARLYGLSINPEQLSLIRARRRPGSRYASLDQCRYETARAEALFAAHGIPFLNTTSVSIEEIAITIIHQYGLH